MTSRRLRLLADSLERNFMTEEDRKRWVSDLRGHAKAIERSILVEPDPLQKEICDIIRKIRNEPPKFS